MPKSPAARQTAREGYRSEPARCSEQIIQRSRYTGAVTPSCRPLKAQTREAADQTSHSKRYVKAAINLPHRKIGEARLNVCSKDTLFVTYRAVPQCNGTARCMLPLVKLGRPVKIMPAA
jgi:hypothetical protein